MLTGKYDWLLASNPRILGVLDPEDKGNMSSKSLVTIYQLTRRNIPENLNLQQHHYEKLQFRQIHHYLLLTSHVISWLKLENLQCMNTSK
jgi:hypothetical protein